MTHTGFFKFWAGIYSLVILFCAGGVWFQVRHDHNVVLPFFEVLGWTAVYISPAMILTLIVYGITCIPERK